MNADVSRATLMKKLLSNEIFLAFFRPIFYVLAIILLTFALPVAFAEDRESKNKALNEPARKNFDDRFDRRQTRQESFIEKGSQSGKLNESSVERLQSEQERIDLIEEKLSDDGITRGEAAYLKKQQDQARRHILGAAKKD